jgi:thiol:disulfide interchange protein
MKRRTTLLLIVLALLSFLPVTWPDRVVEAAEYVPVTKYDPARNAEKDISDATAEAKRSGKRVLLEVGGDWCAWCKTMDNFYAQNTQLKEIRTRNYVAVKVNYSPENRNEKVLERYPKGASIPYVVILDGDGKMLHSQDAAPLESGNTYDLAKFTAFLKKWAPSK